MFLLAEINNALVNINRNKAAELKRKLLPELSDFVVLLNDKKGDNKLLPYKPGIKYKINLIKDSEGRKYLLL